MKQGEILDVVYSRSGGNGVVNHERTANAINNGRAPKTINPLVLSDVIIGSGGVVERKSSESSGWHVLFVFAPSNPFVFQKVDNAGDICRNIVQIVVVHPKVFSTGYRNIVWLRRVCYTEEVYQLKPLLCQGREVCYVV